MTATAYRNARRLRKTALLPSRAAFTLGAALLGGMVSVTGAQEDRADLERVLQMVDAVFDGMRAKDPALLRSAFATDARIGSGDVESFVSNVVAAEAHLDEVTFDETVLIDDDLAVAWTPYNIFIDGAFHHCGVDLFVMRRTDTGWQITSLEDTRRTEGCDPDRRK